VTGDISIRGAEKLEAAARSLKAAGRGDLRKELLRGLRESAKPTIKELRVSALRDLPKKGGLAALVAKSRFSVRNRLSGKTVGMRIEGQNNNARGLEAIDKGTVRHPVYGNRKAWAVQSVHPGWFTKPAEEAMPTIRREVQRVLDDVAAKVERSV
jgi:hypothetical protein